MFTIYFYYCDNRDWVEIARVSGCEAAYEAYTKACELAEMVGADCALMDTITGECLEEFNVEED